MSKLTGILENHMSKKCKAVLRNGTLVDAEILDEKDGWFGKRYFIKYRVDTYGDNGYEYSNEETQWVKQVFNIEEENTK